MPLVFSPLSEEVLDSGPARLFPKSVFLMRQLGTPPEIDQAMAVLATRVFEDAGISVLDASSSTGGKDFLERILGLIRGSGFVAALFGNNTRRTAFANISLELGFAAMCGKPLVIIKSRNARAPSDLTRTDWIDYDRENEDGFISKLGQAVSEINALADFEKMKLEVALEADRMDCAIAFERTRKAFLLTSDVTYVHHARTILDRLNEAQEQTHVGELHRERDEVRLFIKQAAPA